MGWALATFVAACLVALASPGPAFIAQSQTALSQGRRPAIAMGVGLATIASFWCGLALFGLTTLFDYVPWLYSAMKIIGGLYLIWIAQSIWRTARAPLRAARSVSGRSAFFTGCLINLTNPKSVLFAGSILLAIFPMDLTLTDKAVIIATIFTCEVSFYSLMAASFSRPALRARYANAKLWLDRSAAAVLGGLGINFILSDRTTP